MERSGDRAGGRGEEDMNVFVVRNAAWAAILARCDGDRVV